MRIATYNVEWFNNLFDDQGGVLDNRGWSGRHDVRRTDQLAALGIVFTALNADAIMVIEAPDHNGRRTTVPALENFAGYFDLRARKAVMGFPNDTQQEIALLYDPDTMSARHDPLGDPTGKKGDPGSPRFDGVFRIDLDIDATEDLVRFSKPPLELAIETVSGRSLRMIGAHLKSKAPHGAQNRDEVMRMAIANRRKQLAQAIWLRGRVDEHLARGESLILLGDLNDGPGLDEYEDLFGRSSVEIVMGTEGHQPLCDPHAHRALQQRIGAMPTSARFYLSTEKRYLQALLDYIMISEDLRALEPRWRIWHPFDDPVCWSTPELRDALITASDHFPVTLDIGL
ncbi:Endonuclease/Exonuclease/phosphatase family protein [Lutimaribacter pacificus]|uniref:Endonuclease/Exonuclease/phosphatase family protein n=1 Tax=Lutimaribacter pacificus TaxID=391948 RepID=A0A1H0BKN8_9RHOB|nr:endonuclease/exonuclease/phosphatase family protein [Lutimaribacter pacificus]SDN46229.1 Endonuclease/Exonuclease/phosphatase family protein [Lutimaribacter pacificus]SHJ55022.1 Endonuclease/Exonuclease/phosphatase family protein [Lutimaribacter pacificus]